MARFLRELLHAHEPGFTTAIRQLESATGNQSIDVRYIANITERAHAAMRRMGLDPTDTTKLELYKALEAHADARELFRDTRDVGLSFAGDVISFNIDDVAANRTRTYEMRTSEHLACQLKHTILGLYTQLGKLDATRAKEIGKIGGLDECEKEDYHEMLKTRQAEDEKDARPRVLCVGDMYNSVYLDLDPKHARLDIGKGEKRLSVPLGNVPYGGATIVVGGGPAANAAVGMVKLGVRADLMGWLGNDVVAKQSLAHLADQQVGTEQVVVANHYDSNVHYVLRRGANRTVLLSGREFDYKWIEPRHKPDWVYLTALGDASWRLHQDIIEYLDANKDVKLAFQPGESHFEWGIKKLAKIYKRAALVVMNRQEAARVSGKKLSDISGIASALRELGPETVVITDGPNGAFVSTGDKLLFMPAYPDELEPIDRTGAGHAFAATVTALLATGKSIDDALLWAPINSMSVAGKLGGQDGLLDTKQIKRLLKKAVPSYKQKEIIQ